MKKLIETADCYNNGELSEIEFIKAMSYYIGTMSDPDEIGRLCDLFLTLEEIGEVEV